MSVGSSSARPAVTDLHQPSNATVTHRLSLRAMPLVLPAEASTWSPERVAAAQRQIDDNFRAILDAFSPVLTVEETTALRTALIRRKSGVTDIEQFNVELKAVIGRVRNDSRILPEIVMLQIRSSVDAASYNLVHSARQMMLAGTIEYFEYDSMVRTALKHVFGERSPPAYLTLPSDFKDNIKKAISAAYKAISDLGTRLPGIGRVASDEKIKAARSYFEAELGISQTQQSPEGPMAVTSNAFIVSPTAVTAAKPTVAESASAPAASAPVASVASVPIQVRKSVVTVPIKHKDLTIGAVRKLPTARPSLAAFSALQRPSAVSAVITQRQDRPKAAGSLVGLSAAMVTAVARSASPTPSPHPPAPAAPAAQDGSVYVPTIDDDAGTSVYPELVIADEDY